MVGSGLLIKKEDRYDLAAEEDAQAFSPKIIEAHGLNLYGTPEKVTGDKGQKACGKADIIPTNHREIHGFRVSQDSGITILMPAILVMDTAGAGVFNTKTQSISPTSLIHISTWGLRWSRIASWTLTHDLA